MSPEVSRAWDVLARRYDYKGTRELLDLEKRLEKLRYLTAVSGSSLGVASIRNAERELDAAVKKAVAA